jgi:hypothetical protein
MGLPYFTELHAINMEKIMQQAFKRYCVTSSHQIPHVSLSFGSKYIYTSFTIVFGITFKKNQDIHARNMWQILKTYLKSLLNVPLRSMQDTF